MSIVEAMLRDAVAGGEDFNDEHPKTSNHNHTKPSLVDLVSDPSVPPEIAVRIIRTVHQVMGEGRSPGPVFYLEPEDQLEPINDFGMDLDDEEYDDEYGDDSGNFRPLPFGA